MPGSPGGLQYCCPQIKCDMGGQMAERIQQEIGGFGWWRARRSRVIHEGGARWSDLLRWAHGAVVTEYRLAVDGQEFVEAIKLHHSLQPLRERAPLPDMLVGQALQEVLDWCSKHGLPGSALLTLHEIALPATRVDADEDDAAEWRQQVYVRDAGRWSAYSRAWVQFHHYDPSAEEAVDTSWWPTAMWKGGITHNHPDGTSTAALLDQSEWFTSEPPGMPCPLPGTRLWHQHAYEDQRGFLRALDAFAGAVAAARAGEGSPLSRFLAGCSYTMRPAGPRYARSKLLPQWSVSSLWSGLALQAMHAITKTRFGYCKLCGSPFLRRRDAKYCKRGCLETSKKRQQRAGTAAKAPKGTPRGR